MAAILDKFTDIQSIADNAYLDVRPGTGEEVTIHNIYYEDDIEVYRYDGTNEILFLSASDNGCLAFYSFHCTRDDRIRLKNVAGTTKLIGYDGVYTKV